VTLPALFAAPEQLDDDGSYFDNKISLKADIWGVGCILLQCLTGQSPWDTSPDSKVLNEVINKRKHPPIPPAIEDDYTALLEQCFQYQPKDRPNAREVCDALQVARQTREKEIAGMQLLQDLHIGLSASPEHARENREAMLSAAAATEWVEKAKRCTVKLTLLDETTLKDKRKRALCNGSGSIVSRDGVVTTAAHVVTQSFTSTPTPGVACVLVGIHDESRGFEWRYLATVVTPKTLLFEQIAEHDKLDRQPYLDLAVLQIVHTLKTCSDKIKEEGKGFFEYEIDETAPPPHDLDFLQISDNSPSSLTKGDDLWLLGYPPKLATGLIVDRKMLSGFSDSSRSFLLADMVNTAHSGASGGPILNEAGQLAAVMSKDESYIKGRLQISAVSVSDAARGLSFFRNISLLTEGHGLPADVERAPLGMRWRDSVQQQLGDMRAEIAQLHAVMQSVTP